VLKLRRIADRDGHHRIDAAVEKDVWQLLGAWPIDTLNAGLIGALTVDQDLSCFRPTGE